MEKTAIRKIVEWEVLQVLARQTGRKMVPAAVSNRHIHLCAADAEALFGKGYRLTPMRPLSQPGQFVCEETLTLSGPGGKIERVRVLGPEREQTQVEISVTDSYRLGIPPVVRMSGELGQTPGCTLFSSEGCVELAQGVIVSARHLHLSGEQAACYSLKDGDAVNLRCGGKRPVVLERVVVRAGAGHELEVHIDQDEANAAMIKTGDFLEMISKG